MTRWVERRLSLRYPCDLAATYRAASGPSGDTETTGSATIRNISCGGIGFLADRHLASAHLAIELPAAIATFQVPVKVSVRHTTERAGGWYHGGDFPQPTLNEELLPGQFLPPRPIILLVEEDAAVRDILDMSLRLHGLGTWPVASGAEAIAVFQRHQQDIALVLLDVGMTGLDGAQTLTRLQALDANVRCWFMTGGAAPYTDAQLRDHGAAVVLHKPFPLDEIALALKRVTGCTTL